mmetsp:Transcript_47596/g.101856  ORF Transcript_47596/g.101856 Transcript_47596/m.101856 type:complete len:1064 (+) Transcript_47596:137-3328(+)
MDGNEDTEAADDRDVEVLLPEHEEPEETEGTIARSSRQSVGTGFDADEEEEAFLADLPMTLGTLETSANRAPSSASIVSVDTSSIASPCQLPIFPAVSSPPPPVPPAAPAPAAPALPAPPVATTTSGGNNDDVNIQGGSASSSSGKVQSPHFQRKIKTRAKSGIVITSSEPAADSLDLASSLPTMAADDLSGKHSSRPPSLVGSPRGTGKLAVGGRRKTVGTSRGLLLERACAALEAADHGAEGPGHPRRASTGSSRTTILEAPGAWGGGGGGGANTDEHDHLSFITGSSFTQSALTNSPWTSEGEDAPASTKASGSKTKRPGTGKILRRNSKHFESFRDQQLGGYSAQENTGGSLKNWLLNFDTNFNGRISSDEFQMGLEKLGYSDEQIKMLWEEFDQDRSGEITFDEIEHEQTQIWNCFRRWCGTQFSTPLEMIVQFRDGYAERHDLPITTEEDISRSEFVEGLAENGWGKGLESLLFDILDSDGEGRVGARDLEWIVHEAAKQRRKDEMKQKALVLKRKAAERRHNGQIVLQDFKTFLRRNFGFLFRAWRRALDLDGSMTVSKTEIFKACKALGYKGDVRALWKALDHDESGTTTLEELDPQCAQLLALFQRWAVMHFGPKPSGRLFSSIDKARRRKLSYEAFCHGIEAAGFTHKTKLLAAYFDWEDKKHLLQEDFGFLDFWRPPQWLVATPSESAAQEVRKAIQARYGNVLKGWRQCLDKDSSNLCTWHEFQEGVRALRLVHFDVAGAWLAFDKDMHGYITLKELDTEAHTILMSFRRWTEEEFGGVKTAFRILDLDASGSLSYAEFRQICRNYGFPGDSKLLFDCLDLSKERSLNVKEVAFLDDWEDVPPEEERVDFVPTKTYTHKAHLPLPSLLEWQLPSPGPGAYDVPALFGAKDSLAGRRHNGAFSFGGAKSARIARSVGPGSYDASLRTTTSRKPAWSFGGSRPTARRKQVLRKPEERNQRQVSRERAATSIVLALDLGEPEALFQSESDDGQERASPGPGAYEPRAASGAESPKYSMRPRRPLKLHPAMPAQAPPKKPTERPHSAAATRIRLF